MLVIFIIKINKIYRICRTLLLNFFFLKITKKYILQFLQNCVYSMELNEVKLNFLAAWCMKSVLTSASCCTLDRLESIF